MPRPRAENFPTLDKDGDLDVSLRSFEKTCRQYQLPKEQWARYLTPGLKGPALEAFAELPDESDQDYEAIKAAWQRRYNLTPEVYRKKFRSLQKQAVESYSAVVSHLTTLFRQWVRGLKIDTLESLEDLLIKEQFVQLCPPEIQEWLLDRKPETALEAGELADFHAANRASVDQSRGSPKGSSGWKPNSARPPDITAAAHPSVPVSAGEGGANPSSPGRSVRRRCFICDSTNHLLAACPQRKKPATTAGGGYPSTSPSVLFVTRLEGSANVNQQAVIVGTQVSVGLQDTAAEVTLVRPGLVSPADFIPGKTLAVKGFGGVRPAVPMARVYLDWGAGRGLREVGVSENIPTEVLLGTDLGKLVSQYVLERDAGNLPRPTSGSTVGRAVCGDAQQDSWTGGQGMAVSQSAPAPAPGVPEVLCGSMRGQCDWEERQGVSECPPAPESAGSLDPMRGEAAVPMVEVGTRWRSAGSRAQGPSLLCDGVDQNAWEGWQDTVVCLPRPDAGLSVTPYGWEQGQGMTAGLLALKPTRTLVPRENGVDQNAWEGWQDTVVCLPRPDSGVSVTPRGCEGEQRTKAGSFRAEPTGLVVLGGRCVHRKAWDEQDTVVCQPVSRLSETVHGAEGILGGREERPRVAEGYPGPEPSRL
uniref:SCAN box domain-containing protein n=1 Tax=Leptobrachium leishanense TaxID=445787 RepID=A0A8C5PDF9_9ANUR